MKKYTIILDPGHYDGCPGKRAPKAVNGVQLFEWKYALELAQIIKKKLEGAGFEVIILKQHKTLTARANEANAIIKAKNNPCIMVSIHGNAAGNGTDWYSAKGWEVWSTVGTTNSDKLAQCFMHTFPSVFPDRKLRGHKEKDFTVIKLTNCPCVLTENFFYDNEEECSFMLKEDTKERLAILHMKAILKYISAC